MMTVSVIVRAYNRAYVIQDALKSIAAQTFAPLEIIVVDDGSTDNTSQVVRALENHRIYYFRHAENRGVAATANTGIKAARGDLIAFLDSDDIWKPSYLEQQVRFMERHIRVGAVFSDTQLQENGTDDVTLLQRLTVFSKLVDTLPGNEVVVPKRGIYLCLLQEIPMKPSALVIRKAMFTAVGQFDESWRSGEDWEFMLRLVEVTDIGFTRTPLVVQRHFRDATHSLYRGEDKQSLLALFISKKQHMHTDREALIAIRKGISTHSTILGWHYLQSGNRRAACRTYLVALRHTRGLPMLARAFASYLPRTMRTRLQQLWRLVSQGSCGQRGG